jgi:hypothetical protein
MEWGMDAGALESAGKKRSGWRFSQENRSWRFRILQKRKEMGSAWQDPISFGDSISEYQAAYFSTFMTPFMIIQ